MTISTEKCYQILGILTILLFCATFTVYKIEIQNVHTFFSNDQIISSNQRNVTTKSSPEVTTMFENRSTTQQQYENVKSSLNYFTTVQPSTGQTMKQPEVHTNFYRTIDNNGTITTNKTKHILFWDTFHGDTAMNLGLGADIFKNCPVKNCVTTHNRTLPEEEFDAVVFHGARYKHNLHGFPKKRNSYQKYIFFSTESPYNTYFDTGFDSNFYNWTMTYREDSDIHFPYGVIRKERTNYTLPEPEEITKRPKMVAWLVSNCETGGTRRRQKYVKELQKYISVDIYGRCGTLKCGKNCNEMFAKDYKFYLAFENSMCTDYATEKMYNPLMLNIIPIVLGFADYNKMAPPHSVIDTRDFTTPKILAEYLLKLNNSVDDYLSYFEWKKSYSVSKPTEYVLCQMCDLLNRPIIYTNYSDIKEWYYGYNKCYD